MHYYYYYGRTRGKGHSIWLLTVEIFNREEIFKSLSPLIANWSFLMQAIHFLMFKQLFSLRRRGLQLTEECSQAVSALSWGCFTSVPWSVLESRCTALSASAFVGLTADQQVKP